MSGEECAIAAPEENGAGSNTIVGDYEIEVSVTVEIACSNRTWVVVCLLLANGVSAGPREDAVAATKPDYERGNVCTAARLVKVGLHEIRYLVVIEIDDKQSVGRIDPVIELSTQIVDALF